MAESVRITGLPSRSSLDGSEWIPAATSSTTYRIDSDIVVDTARDQTIGGLKTFADDTGHGQMPLKRTGTYSSPGELRLGNLGSEFFGTDNDANTQVAQTGGVLHLAQNAVLASSTSWEHEQDGAAGLMEVGREGLGFWGNTSQLAGTQLNTDALRRFAVNNAYDSVTIPSGHHFGVGYGRESVPSPLDVRNDPANAPTAIGTLTRKSSLTGAPVGAAMLRHDTSGTIADGFGAALLFSHKQDGSAANTVAQIRSERNTNNNEGDLVLLTALTGTLTERMRVDRTGLVGIGRAPLASTRLAVAGPDTALNVRNNADTLTLFAVGDTGVITVGDGAEIAAGTGNGLKIGRAASQLLGFFGAAAVAQQTAPAALTDNSGGTKDNTVEAVSGSGADAAINNNFAELTEELNQVRTLLVNLGLGA